MSTFSSLPYARTLTHGPPTHPPPDDIPGLPSLADIRALDVLFDWETLKGFIRDAELGKLKRHPDLQARYDIWTAHVKEVYGGGSTERYILSKRLAFPAAADGERDATEADDADGPRFTRRTPASQYCIAANDWPYSMPHDVFHYVIWTQLPLIPDSQLTPELNDRGVSGFTGSSPAATPSPSPSPAPTAAPGSVHAELAAFVLARWPEAEWETAWFVNPPRLQSVKLLPHFHVFARLKAGVDEDAEEGASA